MPPEELTHRRDGRDLQRGPGPVIEWLRQDKRVSYRALKMQFDLDDATLEALKEELLYVHPVGDDAGRGLIWTGDPAPHAPDARRGPEAESRFHILLRAVMGLLQRERRVTYRELKHVFVLNDPLVEEIREELTFKQLARDEDGKGLVWTGEAQPAVQPAIPIPSQPAAAERNPGRHVICCTSPSHHPSPRPRHRLTVQQNGRDRVGRRLTG